MPGLWKELTWWEVRRGFRCSELYGLWVKITTAEKRKKKGKINHFLMKKSSLQEEDPPGQVPNVFRMNYHAVPHTPTLFIAKLKRIWQLKKNKYIIFLICCLPRAAKSQGSQTGNELRWGIESALPFPPLPFPSWGSSKDVNLRVFSVLFPFFSPPFPLFPPVFFLSFFPFLFLFFPPPLPLFSLPPSSEAANHFDGGRSEVLHHYMESPGPLYPSS